MDSILGIIILIIAIFFWKHTLAGVVGAIIGGLIGSIFGESGTTIGGVIGFIAGINSQNESEDDDDEDDDITKKDTETKSKQKAQTSPKSNSETRIILCPSCRRKIRIKLPLQGNRAKCGNCSACFGLQFDQSGQLKTEYVKSEGASSRSKSASPSVEDYYKTLGLEPSATADEVRTAYRKKIREYHPDRVANLGDKLKTIADKESKAINAAYSMLKAADLAN